MMHPIQCQVCKKRIGEMYNPMIGVSVLLNGMCDGCAQDWIKQHSLGPKNKP